MPQSKGLTVFLQEMKYIQCLDTNNKRKTQSGLSQWAKSGGSTQTLKEKHKQQELETVSLIQSHSPNAKVNSRKRLQSITAHIDFLRHKQIIEELNGHHLLVTLDHWTSIGNI